MKFTMVMFDYFEDVLEGFEFLIALGSLVGLVGLIFGMIFVIWGGSRLRYKMMGVTVVSILLLLVCGFSTGIKYFRIFR
jgi:hypothetical protein